MSHTRVAIRVPIIGKARLLQSSDLVIEARAIDISAVGIRVSNLSQRLADVDYLVEVTTVSRGNLRFTARPVHGNSDFAGLKITEITSNDLKKIYQVITDFQATEDFIKHIDQSEIIDDWFSDESGEQLDISFEVV